MNKQIREAITHGYPMHWETDRDSGAFRLLLIATTRTYENGRTRTGKLWGTYDARLAHSVHGEILAHGGKVSEPTPREIYEKWQEQE